MGKKCYIFGAGEFYGLPYKPASGDYIVAADGGYRYVKENNLVADYIIGDFDSLGFVPKEDNVEIHPVMKDDTDMHMAVKKGLAEDCDTFIIYGGLGGRMDHSLSNIQTLAYIAEKGGRGYLMGDNQVITVLAAGDSLRFDETNKGYVSVFAYGDVAKGVSIKGLLYEVTDYAMEHTRPIGVSNEFTGKKATISLKEGMLMVVWEIGRGIID